MSECLDHSMHTFHAYSRVSMGLLVVLCWSMGLIPMDPPQIAQYASYSSSTALVVILLPDELDGCDAEVLVGFVELRQGAVDG